MSDVPAEVVRESMEDRGGHPQGTGGLWPPDFKGTICRIQRFRIDDRSWGARSLCCCDGPRRDMTSARKKITLGQAFQVDGPGVSGWKVRPTFLPA